VPVEVVRKNDRKILFGKKPTWCSGCRKKSSQDHTNTKNEEMNNSMTK